VGNRIIARDGDVEVAVSFQQLFGAPEEDVDSFLGSSGRRTTRSYARCPQPSTPDGPIGQPVGDQSETRSVNRHLVARLDLGDDRRTAGEQPVGPLVAVPLEGHHVRIVGSRPSSAAPTRASSAVSVLSGV